MAKKKVILDLGDEEPTTTTALLQGCNKPIELGKADRANVAKLIGDNAMLTCNVQAWPKGLDDCGEGLFELQFIADTPEQFVRLIEKLRRLLNQHHVEVFQARVMEASDEAATAA